MMNAPSRKVLSVACGFVALFCFYKALPGLFQSNSSVANAHAAVSSRDRELLTKKLTTSPIQDLKVGMRLVGRNPDRDDAVELPDPDPQTWRKLELRMEHKPGRFVDVVLIRPLEWIEEEEATVGEVLWLELPEMHAAGDAEVLAISACPALEPGSGPVITGTFRHEADELVEIRVAGQPDPLRCTAEHPFWSAMRHEFVAASALRPGEEIETSTGTPALLTSITPRAGPETVYGLEVYGEHVYHVSEAGLLVHNASTSKVPLPEKGHVYEITGTINGKKHSYVGSAFDVEARLSDKYHPARKLIDADDVAITTREVSLSAVTSRTDVFRLLRTQEQISLTSMLRSTGGILNGTQNGWTNLNKIRARALDKFLKNRKQWGDIRGKANDFGFEE